MIPVYLTLLGASGVFCAKTAEKHFFSSRDARGYSQPVLDPSTGQFRQYHEPQTFKDKIYKLFIIYGIPFFVICCGVTGLGTNFGNLFIHVFSEKSGRVPDEIAIMTPSKFISENGVFSFVCSKYFLKYFLLSPIFVSTFDFLCALCVMLIDVEQGSPASFLGALLAGILGFSMTELMMITGVSSSSNLLEPELAVLWTSCSLSGVVVLVSSLFGRVVALA